MAPQRGARLPFVGLTKNRNVTCAISAVQKLVEPASDSGAPWEGVIHSTWQRLILLYKRNGVCVRRNSKRRIDQVLLGGYNGVSLPIFLPFRPCQINRFSLLDFFVSASRQMLEVCTGPLLDLIARRALLDPTCAFLTGDSLLSRGEGIFLRTRPTSRARNDASPNRWLRAVRDMADPRHFKGPSSHRFAQFATTMCSCTGKEAKPRQE